MSRLLLPNDRCPLPAIFNSQRHRKLRVACHAAVAAAAGLRCTSLRTCGAVSPVREAAVLVAAAAASPDLVVVAAEATRGRRSPVLAAPAAA